MANILKQIKIENTAYDISSSWNNITNKPSTYPPSSHTHSKSEVGLGNVDNTADANKNVNYANSAGSVAWDNISSRPITITQRNNDSPVSGAYAYGTYITMRNTNNWFEIYAPHMGTSSSRIYMQTGWDNDRQGWKAIAWTSDIPTSLPASDVYAWAKSPTKPSYTKAEVGLGNVDNTADANKNVNYANSAGSANYFNYGRGAILANSSSFTNNFCKDIFGEENNNNYHLVALRTNSQAPSCLLGDYSSGIAWKGSDTYGSLMVRYNTSEIRVSGGNGANTNPNWTVDLVHSGNIGSQNVNYANSAGSVAWGNVTGKPSTFTPSSHTHDDRYYTESEINSKLNGKSNTNHTHNYLPLSGGTMDGTLIFSKDSNGIKFASDAWYITNIEAGTTSVQIGTAAAGYTTSVTVTFKDYKHGSGSWYVVATAAGNNPAQPECVVVGISDLTTSGVRIRVRKIANNSGAGSPSWNINWIAIKYW